jgi:hypothetical protein
MQMKHPLFLYLPTGHPIAPSKTRNELMAMQKQKSDVNKSQALRDLLAENPHISFQEAISTLAAKGISVKRGLFYFIKARMNPKKRKTKEKVAQERVTATPSSHDVTDALATIKQVKGLATELGGMNTLKALVEAMSE